MDFLNDAQEKKKKKIEYLNRAAYFCIVNSVGYVASALLLWWVLFYAYEDIFVRSVSLNNPNEIVRGVWKVSMIIAPAILIAMAVKEWIVLIVIKINLRLLSLLTL